MQTAPPPITPTPEQVLQALSESVATRHGSDIYLYHGEISTSGYLQLLKAVPKQMEGIPNKAILAVNTPGGDAHAAYRIARLLQKRYDGFTILVYRYCKSAGTLLAVGATEVVFTESGELGPLDVQVRNPNEFWETSSGLTAGEALDFLTSKALTSFRHFLQQAILHGGIPSQRASEIAIELTNGIYGPISAKLDPIRLGETQRAVSIAGDYGVRLADKSQNISTLNLFKLVNSYPSHGFVIDAVEASALFQNVRDADKEESTLADLLSAIYSEESIDDEEPVVRALCLLKRDDQQQPAPIPGIRAGQTGTKLGGDGTTDQKSTILDSHRRDITDSGQSR